MNRMASRLLTLAFLLGGAGQAMADLSLTGTVYENYTNTSSTAGSIGDLANAQASATKTAQFTTTDLNYNSPTYANYFIGSFLNNPTFTNTTGGFSPTDSLANTYIYFTGTATFTPGTQIVSFLHDDGAEVMISQGSKSYDLNQAGPTVADQSPFKFTFDKDPYTVTLAYFQNNLAPARLTLTVTPEPATLTMAAIGLVALGGLQIRRRKQAVA